MTVDSRITLITLGVADVASSTRFYESLGWRKSSASNEQVTFFHSAGTVLGLFNRQALADDAGVENSAVGFSGCTLAQNYNSKTEVDDVFAHALACGAREVKKPCDVFWGGYSGYFADPDGHLWEIAWNPIMPLDSKMLMQLP